MPKLRPIALGAECRLVFAADRLRSYSFDVAGQNSPTQIADGKIAISRHVRTRKRNAITDWVSSTYTFDNDNLKRLDIPLNGAKTTILWDGTDYLGDVT